ERQYRRAAREYGQHRAHGHEQQVASIMPIQQILLGGASPLTADVAPTLVTGHSATFPATVTSNSCTVTASGGTGSYTYEWEYVSGATLEYVSPISSSTQA